MATKEEKQARTERLVTTLRERATQFRDNDELFLRFVRQSVKFHRYSLSNQFLIAVQSPDSTAINSFKKWVTLGRCVRKGESAIWILAPRPYRKENARGVEEDRITFQYVPVFDYAQTDPIEGAAHVWEPYRIPALTDESGEEYVAGLIDWLHHENFMIETFTDSRGYRGQFSIVADDAELAGVIRLDVSMPMLQQLNTLIHEIAHMEHWRADKAAFQTFGKQVHEFVAEASAYAVLADLGFDSATKSVAYVAAMAAVDNDPEKERVVMQMVISTTGVIMKQLEALWPHGEDVEGEHEGVAA